MLPLSHMINISETISRRSGNTSFLHHPTLSVRPKWAEFHLPHCTAYQILCIAWRQTIHVFQQWPSLCKPGERWKQNFIGLSNTFFQLFSHEILHQFWSFKMVLLLTSLQHSAGLSSYPKYCWQLVPPARLNDRTKQESGIRQPALIPPISRDDCRWCRSCVLTV